MEFVLLVAAAATAIYTGTSANRLTAEHARVHEVASDLHRDDLTTYELAYLAGGPRRVVNTALAGLASAEAVRIARGGLVTLVSGASPPAEPVQQDIIAALTDAGGSMQIGALRSTVARGTAMAALKERMTGHGLVIPDESLARLRGRATGLRIASIVSIVISVASLIAEITLIHPRLTATAAVIVAAVAGVIGLIMLRRHQQGLVDAPLSGPGREAVASARRRHIPGVRVEGAVAIALIPVALYGMSEIGDAEIRDELSARESRSSGDGGAAPGACGGGDMSGSGSDGGSDGSSGGGGGSGGSSCGGGCGGGGGGCGGGGGG
ncbi:TIGR04222 domain-containing protein [Sinosporangium album]|uniref:TIGR04222 domain-containing protein n=1 Tax=Sinosporangium album TaxID=504805 RepID=A0A1G7XXP0_9ACTN|nr:TIGR04222 domain-containing membrane protein [Sinosporangium album]SDG88853.1 TIGR04222 domain-containing protein [Sinosporangium album]